MATGRSAVAGKGGTAQRGPLVDQREPDAVMRLLRGEDLDEVSREARVEAHRLAAWGMSSSPQGPRG
jgi:hypothetical protein